MRQRRDQFAKDLLDLLLHRWGKLRTEDPVPATDAQRADVSFVPDAPPPTSLGLLARIAAGACLFELFTDPPSRDALLACLRKLLQWRHALQKKRPELDPMCWVLRAARPTLALRELHFAPSARWPRGVYTCGQWPIAVIVLDELPRERDTVLLRLLGRDATRDGALDALETIPLDPTALDEVVGLFVDYEALGAHPEDPTMPVDLSRYYAWKEQQRAEGRLEGRLEGQAEGEAQGRLLGAIEARLRRVLTDDERARLERRVQRDGREVVHQRALTLDDDDLTRWIAGKRVRSN